MVSKVLGWVHGFELEVLRIRVSGLREYGHMVLEVWGTRYIISQYPVTYLVYYMSILTETLS